ncbi:MAG: hypothetical protein KAY50_11100 [Chitinophagaceae bacterium]|nr:hypothetical protein [Chitinophagaceae bacterium]
MDNKISELLKMLGSLNQQKTDITVKFNLSLMDLDRQIDLINSELLQKLEFLDKPILQKRTLDDYAASADIHSMFTKDVHSFFAKEYDKKWSIPRKTEYVLRENNRCMASREMIDRMIDLEGGVITEDSPTVKKFNDSVGIKSKTKDGFVRIKIYGTLLYGLSEWLDEQGDIKIEYVA